jgi:hypothetical protein
MRRNHAMLDLIIRAVLKLGATADERRNVRAFIQSCYCCRVGTYDLDAAAASLNKLTAEEQAALIEWVVQEDEVAARRRV